MISGSISGSGLAIQQSIFIRTKKHAWGEPVRADVRRLIVARYFARHVATLGNEVGDPLYDQTKTKISEGMSPGSKSV